MGGGKGGVEPVDVEDGKVVIAAGVQVAAERAVCSTSTATGRGGLRGGRDGAGESEQVVRGRRSARLKVGQVRVQVFQRRCERAVCAQAAAGCSCHLALGVKESVWEIESNSESEWVGVSESESESE